MARIKTKTGFEIELDGDILDDMETFEILVDIDKGEMKRLPDLLQRTLSEDQKKALYEHCRVDGRVKLSAVLNEMSQIFEELGGKK